MALLFFPPITTDTSRPPESSNSHGSGVGLAGRSARNPKSCQFAMTVPESRFEKMPLKRRRTQQPLRAENAIVSVNQCHTSTMQGQQYRCNLEPFAGKGPHYPNTKCSAQRQSSRNVRGCRRKNRWCCSRFFCENSVGDSCHQVPDTHDQGHPFAEAACCYLRFREQHISRELFCLPVLISSRDHCTLVEMPWLYFSPSPVTCSSSSHAADCSG